MSNRKPNLPAQSHIRMALAVTEAVSGASADEIETLPKSVRDSLDFFADVADTSARIAVEQPETLAAYRDDLVALASSNTDPEALVDALLGSYVMARMLADVAASNVEPVAVTAKTKPAAKKAAATKRTAPAKKATPAPRPAEPDPVTPPVDDAVEEPPTVPAPEIDESIPPAAERVGSVFDQAPDDDF